MNLMKILDFKFQVSDFLPVVLLAMQLPFNAPAESSSRLLAIIPTPNSAEKQFLLAQNSDIQPRGPGGVPIPAQPGIPNIPRPVPGNNPNTALPPGSNPTIRPNIGAGARPGVIPPGAGRAVPNVPPPGAVPGARPAGAMAAGATSTENAGNEEEGYSLQFPNTPLPEILLLYEELTGKKLIRDINVEGATITIDTTGKLPKADAIEYIEKSLLLNGYAFVPSGPKMLKVIAFDAKKPTMEGGVLTYFDAKELPETDVVVNYLLPLTYIDPEEAIKVIQELVPAHSYGKIQPVPNSRALIITENSASVRQIVQLMKHLDVPPSLTTQKSFQLTRENAEDVKKALDDILDTEGKKSGGSGGSSSGGGAQTPRPTSPVAQPTAPPIPGQPAQVQPRTAIVSNPGGAQVSSGAVPPKIIAVPRTNKLIVIAKPTDMTYIEALIEELDGAAELRNFATRQLKYLGAAQALDILESAITRGNDQAGGASGGGGGSKAAGTSSGTPTNQTTSGLGNNNSFGRSGSSSFGQSGFGQSGGGGFGGGGGGIGGGGGMSGGSTQPLRQEEGVKSLVVGKTLLIADSTMNRIFASGPPEHLRVINEIMDELDVRPQQILISVVIGEVTLADGVEFGLDWFFKPTELRYKGNEALIGGALRNGGAAIVDPNNIVDLADLAEVGNGLSLYGAINENVNVVMNALKSNTAFKVISRPSVFTQNNKPATISSGSSIPVPTQTFSSFNGGVDGNQGLTSNISYQDIALSLAVTPLINTDEELTLSIQQQNNEQSGTTTINGNPYPTISSQQVQTIVMCKNNDTVLLGGLIRENSEKERGGIPVLSSIPGLKYLFGSKKDRKTRRELLVFIHPRIVTGEGDLPPNVQDTAGTSAFSDETKAFMRQEQSAPVQPVKTTKLGRLIDKLLH